MKDKEFDLIVAGAGLAGCCAATAAARRGRRVLIIERYGFPGGMAAAGLVNPFMRYVTHGPGGGLVKVNNGGLFAGILDELESRGAMYSQDKEGFADEKGGMEPLPVENVKYTFNEETLKLVLEDMMENAGVRILYHSFVYGVEAGNGIVKTVLTAGKGGTGKYEAGFFIDATGDADLCDLAGFETELGRKSDGMCQPMTLCFRVGNADPYMAERTIYDPEIRKKLNDRYKELQEKGVISNRRENILVFPHMGNGVLHFNSTRVIGRDPLDPAELTKAEMEARKQVSELVDFFREYAEGFENCILLQMAPQIGIRESRRIKGLYELTGDDLVNCVGFDDSIARGCYGIDIHNPSGSGTTIRHIPEGGYYTIPLRSIIPKGSKNLLVAGRPISSTHEAHSATRVMPICANIGEAAGIVGSMCIRKGVVPEEINIGLLHSEMDKAGALY